ncbi:MAG: CoA-acylating methylmalonate-semialdehyde dehydrogenase [Planctomycetota bacterium]|nr:CoA-acylating methylmalonate-semialdehyde dehydrogenase [Planctomycetota bacterium]
MKPEARRAPAPHASKKLNLIAGSWSEGQGAVTRKLLNPADTTEVVAEVREAALNQVDAACEAAHAAFLRWRSTPVLDRVQVLFKFKQLLEAHYLELAELLVRENGKLLSEAKGDVRRGFDVVDFACGIATHLQGRTLPDVSSNVDTYMIREAVGVVAGIPPFNFPAMIPLWMMPIAVACGNAFVLKPAEKAPLTGTRLAELFTQAGLPEGVVSVVQGGKEVSERLIAHPHVRAVSFVGSSAVAESVYKLAAQHGKRVQALGGAKNHLIVLPDADLERSIPALIGSCYGCAGQRCLAGSVVIAVGDQKRQDAVRDAFVAAARKLVPGDGLEEGATLPPVIGIEHKAKVEQWIERGVRDGARLILDGRNPKTPSHPHGCFVGATVFDGVTSEMPVAQEEVFGPVVNFMRAKDADEAIDISNRTRFGNSASLFTQDGAAVRRFRERIQCGMLGVNLGVPAPMAMFSFGGWKGSFFGDLHAYGPDAVDFYTKKKVVTERWFGAEAPKDGWV